MIGGTLIRFHPDGYQSGSGMFGQIWKGIKKRGPGILKDVLKESAMEGYVRIKGVRSSGDVQNYRTTVGYSRH